MSEKYPASLLYTSDHEWARMEGNIAVIGVTHHAQEALGEIVFLELPKVGTELNKGDTFGVVESIKAVSDLYSPISGRVVEVNSGLTDSPGKINTDPYQGSWMIKIESTNPAEVKSLLNADAYKKLVDSI